MRTCNASISLIFIIYSLFECRHLGSTPRREHLWPAIADNTKRRRVTKATERNISKGIPKIQDKLNSDRAEEDIREIVGQLREQPHLVLAVKASLAMGVASEEDVFPRDVKPALPVYLHPHPPIIYHFKPNSHRRTIIF